MRFSLSPDDGGTAQPTTTWDARHRLGERPPPPDARPDLAIDPGSDTYRQNRAAMEGAAGRGGGAAGLARAGGGERYVERHRERGKMLAHERMELLLDRDSPFLELAPLAGWGTPYTVGASLVSGIGVVSGVECIVSANDPTVRGGDQSLHHAQVVAAGRHRPREPAALDQPGRVGGCRPAHAVRDLHPRRDEGFATSPNAPPRPSPPSRSCSATPPPEGPTSRG